MYLIGDPFKMRNIFTIFILCFFASACKSKNDCILGVGGHSQIPSCLSVSGTASTKSLYEWVYLNDEANNSLEFELARLNKFKEHLSEGDFHYLKAEIYSSKDMSEEAMSLYRKADELGSTEAGYELFRMIDKRKNYDLAIKYLQSSAEKGNIDSLYFLGVELYYPGRRLGQNKNKAIELFETAAMKGQSQALLQLVDNEVVRSLSDNKRLFWSIVYNIYESDTTSELSQLMSSVEDWRGFCTRFKKYEAQDSIDAQVLTSEKYGALKQIILRCSSI